MDIDGSVLAFSFQVDVEHFLILDVGKYFCAVESHNVLSDRLHTLQLEVHVVNTEVSVYNEKIDKL